PAVNRTPPGLLWNASASAPIGLYTMRPMPRPVRGILVVIAPPAPIARFAAERHYLPLSVPLIKPVAATAGHIVCRADLTITIDRRAVGRALLHDGSRRPLPVWQGSRTLGPGEAFVINAAGRDRL